MSDDLKGMQAVMTPSEYKAWLERRLSVLEDDVEMFGPAGNDRARIAAMKRALAELENA